MIPDYLKISAADLGKGQPVQVRIKGDMISIACDLAEAIVGEIVKGEATGDGATLIIPVGPVDHFPILAGMLNERKISCRNTVFINMDEYLTDDDQWIPLEHPLSFRGYMERAFYSLLSPSAAPPESHRVFPDPRDPDAIPRLIASRYFAAFSLSIGSLSSGRRRAHSSCTVRQDQTRAWLSESPWMRAESKALMPSSKALPASRVGEGWKGSPASLS